LGAEYQLLLTAASPPVVVGGIVWELLHFIH
jgi:hypothetical protein